MVRRRASAAAVLVLLALASAPASHAQPTKPGSTHVAFFGSGFLIPYYGGVIEVLQQAGVIGPNTPLSGNSGGAWASVAVAVDFNMSMMATFVELLADGDSLAESLNAILPDDVADKLNARPVAQTFAQLDATQTDFNGSVAWVVQEWTSKSDVVEGMMGTACLPCFTANGTYCTFRGQPVLDGGYAASWEDLCPQGTDTCLKISAQTTAAMEAGDLPGVDECPYPTRADNAATVLYANPGAPATWPLAAVQQNCNPAGGEPWPLPDQVQDWADTLPDIYPGKYGPLGTLNGTQITACEWESWTRALPEGLELEAIEAMAAQGARDAAMWLKSRGPGGAR